MNEEDPVISLLKMAGVDAGDDDQWLYGDSKFGLLL